MLAPGAGVGEDGGGGGGETLIQGRQHPGDVPDVLCPSRDWRHLNTYSLRLYACFFL